MLVLPVVDVHCWEQVTSSCEQMIRSNQLRSGRQKGVKLRERLLHDQQAGKDRTGVSQRAPRATEHRTLCTRSFRVEDLSRSLFLTLTLSTLIKLCGFRPLAVTTGSCSRISSEYSVSISSVLWAKS